MANGAPARLLAQGWITPTLHRIVTLINWPSERIIHKKLTSAFGGADLHSETVHNAKRVDNFVATCTGISLLLYIATVSALAPSLMRILALLFVTWRIIDTVAVTFRMTLFKEWDYPVVAITSHARVITLGILNYVEIWLCFAVMYAIHPGWLRTGGECDWLTPLYFSAVTQLTIGYGDVTPVGSGRGATILQGGIGLLLLVLLLGRFIAGLPPLTGVEKLPEKK